MFHTNSQSRQPSFKPITPDSPEPRLGYSPRTLHLAPKPHAETVGSPTVQLRYAAGQYAQHSSAVLTSPTAEVRCPAEQPIRNLRASQCTSPTVLIRYPAGEQAQLAAAAHAGESNAKPRYPVLQHVEEVNAEPSRSPSKQLRYHCGQQTQTQTALHPRSSAVQHAHNGNAVYDGSAVQPRYPIAQQGGTVQSRSPAVHLTCLVKQQQQPIQHRQHARHLTKAHAVQSRRSPAKGALHKQQKHSKSPGLAGLQGRSKAVPEWNSDFSIQYEDPVSIKDQERMQGNAHAAFGLPPLPGSYKGTCCSTGIVRNGSQTNSSSRHGGKSVHSAVRSTGKQGQQQAVKGCDASQLKPLGAPQPCRDLTRDSGQSSKLKLLEQVRF